MNVPLPVRNKARILGATQWLDQLPQLVAALAEEWGLTPGRIYPDATEALVLEVEPAAVLKLLLPRGDACVEHEVRVLELADGQGCARLLRADVPRGALLLERLGRSLFDLGWPLPRRQEVICATVRQLWRPVRASGLPTGQEKARGLAQFIAQTWEELGHPCSRRPVDLALALARQAAERATPGVLVHGDAHQWNTLEAGEGFKLVDPDGLLAEPEYDVGIGMREDPAELLDGPTAKLTAERAAFLAHLTGLDPQRIWEWGYIERVSTGLLATRIDLQPYGRQALEVSERLAGEPAAP